MPGRHRFLPRERRCASDSYRKIMARPKLRHPGQPLPLQALLGLYEFAASLKLAVALIFSAAVVLCCGADEADYRRRASAIQRDPEELRTSAAAGTPGEVAARLREWNAAGADRIYLQMLDLSDLEHLDLVAEQVAPELD